MQWQVGNVTVTRIEEMVGPMFDPIRFFPDFDPAVFEQHADWLYPDHVDAISGNIIASMHSWLIQTGRHNILIDTCIGNDKPRQPFKDWHELNTPWLKNFEATGISPYDIDFVMCTHLHVDHVGWNTRLSNGQWVPTFPNAKYIFSKTEFEFWERERAAPDPTTFAGVNNQTFDDSVMPILHLAELIDGETEIIADLLKINPAPGHTPGSIAIELSDQGELGLFTGDICHHPIQVAEPHWNSAYCELPDAARATRAQVLDYCHNHQALMLPAHFAGGDTQGYAGRIQEKDQGFRFNPD